MLCVPVFAQMKTSPPIAAPFARAAQCGLIDAAFYVCLDNSGSLQIVSLEHSSQVVYFYMACIIVT